MRRWHLILLFAAIVGPAIVALPILAAPLDTADLIETPAEAMQRHECVAERRGGTDIICHRGSSEFAKENTLEAYRATFELGGDGNEIDIRATMDGVLVCFHDDMLDQHLEAYGDVADWLWEDLQQLPFRNPGQFGDQCRIPTLAEVFQLHRRHAGLMHLDIKRPGLDKAIAELLTKMDMWDHVGYCNTDHGGVILTDERYKPRRYKGGLYLDRGEVFPDAIAAVLQNPGDGVIVDDPRGVVVALGRKLGTLSTAPVAPKQIPLPIMREAEANPFAILQTTEATSDQILLRARAADQLLNLRVAGEAFTLLEERVRNRALHKEWMYHGLDGATALR
ncbi:MAG: glycerophosphodiester phosphodiesterase, partial [Pirellulaceae bacterium]